MDPGFDSSNLSLDNNEGRIIDNPLKRKALPKVLKEARLFADRANADRKLFEKAARIARDPPARKKGSTPDWSIVPDLTEHEKFALDEETTLSFWRQPKDLRITVVTLCFSAIIQGWIQTGSNGGNINWPLLFGLIDPKTNQWKDNKSLWIFAGVNAVTYLTASLFGCWLSDPLQSILVERQRRFTWISGIFLGRKGAILIAALLCFVSLIGASCTHTWQQLLVCRAILGLGMGAKASITPIFGAEISPSHLRGALVMNWQLFDAFGIFLGFTANLILYRVGDLSWRFQMGSACIPTLCLLSLIWTVPESPRWLLKQDRVEEAFAAMCLYRATPLQAARELFYANAQLQIEVALLKSEVSDVEAKQSDVDMAHIEHVETMTSLDDFQGSSKNTSYWTRIWLLFQKPRTRRASVAAAVVMMSQQLCGVNILAFYSSTFFSDVGGVDTAVSQAVWMSWGWGLANFLFTFPAYYHIDKRGRRFLLLATYPWMTLCMLGACLSFLCDDSKTQRALVGIFMFLFVLCYSMGQGPVAFAYSSEVFPLVNREAGMSFAVCVNLLGAGLLTLLVPLAQISGHPGNPDKMYAYKQSQLLGVFVGFNVLAFLLIFFFVPETAGTIVPKEEGQLNYIRLEELNYIFAVRTTKHIDYQINIVVPWIGRMGLWLLTRRFQKTPNRPIDPEPLYVWSVLDAQEMESVGTDPLEQAWTSGTDVNSIKREQQKLSFSPMYQLASVGTVPEPG